MILSICIPTYNRANKLYSTLSFITREFLALPFCEQQDCEIIIRDNCSLDDTFKTIRILLELCPQIKYYRNEGNIGASPNFIKITGDAKGDYVWWLGDDDSIHEGILCSILNKIRQYHPEMLFLNHRAGDFQCNNVNFESAIGPNTKEFYKDGKDAIAEISSHSGVGALLFMSSRIIKRTTLVESFKGVILPSGTLTLHSAFYAASRGSVVIIKELYIENEYSEISWKDRQEKIAFREIPDTLNDLQEMSYSNSQTLIIKGSYLTFAKKQQILLYNLKVRNSRLYPIFKFLLSLEFCVYNFIKSTRNDF